MLKSLSSLTWPRDGPQAQSQEARSGNDGTNAGDQEARPGQGAGPQEPELEPKSG